MPPKRYRLYIDESGDHTYSTIDKPEKRYLGITGVIFESEYYRREFHPQFEDFKQRHFPHSPDEPVILHRKEIIGRHGPFWRLRDAEKEKAFNDDFLKLLQEKDYLVISVVIDKKAHADRYQESALHPYHYCLVAMLERYCGFLNFFNAQGDVMAESRGGKEDMQLKEAYQRVYESGTQFRNLDFFQKTLTSKEIKIKPKSANITGLQLADLLAHPCKNEILFEQKRIDKGEEVFGTRVCQCVSGKYNRHIFQNRVQGYGKVFLG